VCDLETSKCGGQAPLWAVASQKNKHNKIIITWKIPKYEDVPVKKQRMCDVKLKASLEDT
jgi:hypothetical protein